MTRKSMAVVSAVLFGADACFELGRVVLGRPWPGVAAGLSHFVSITLAGVWLGAAALQLLRQRRPTWNTTAQLICIAGTLMMVFHAAVTRVLGSYVGLGNLLLAAAQVFLLRHAFPVKPRNTLATHRA
jgi:hypothetical protein